MHKLSRAYKKCDLFLYFSVIVYEKKSSKQPESYHMLFSIKYKIFIGYSNFILIYHNMYVIKLETFFLNTNIINRKTIS